jgi:hypothetical protein
MDPNTLDLEYELGMSEVHDSIIPNAMLRFAGSAYLSSEDGGKKSKVGSVVETDQGTLLLWLCAYPLQGQDVEIVFLDDKGFSEHDVGVLIDHKENKPEFVIGTIAFAGRTASVTLFGSPASSSSLIIREPLKTKHT